MAKTFDHLFPEITSFLNLFEAFRKAAKGKRGQSVVADFEYNLERNLFDLQEQLLAKTYHPGAYRSFYIHDPKHRLVSAAPFRDRVVHHALCNVIESIFERTFIGDSYANRKGKGTHAAINRAQAWAKTYPYVLQCDLRQFFPSVDHQILRSILARKIIDDDALWLIDQIIDGGAGVLDKEYQPVFFPGDDLIALMRPRGLPIGNLTSQFWANVYLNEHDQFIKRELRCHAYLRYVDDVLIFHHDKKQLWAWKDAMRERLNALRLSLHERESTVYPVKNGIPFLGFRIYPSHRRLKRRNVMAFIRRLRNAYRQVERGEMTLDELTVHIRAWTAHAAHGDTWRLRSALFAQPVPLLAS